MRFGATWTKRGAYNWAMYEPGETITALPQAPKAQASYVVYWFPGKPTLGCVLGTPGDPLSQVHRLDALRGGSGLVVWQEPVEGGAWWVRLRDGQPAGPYNWDVVFNWDWEQALAR